MATPAHPPRSLQAPSLEARARASHGGAVSDCLPGIRRSMLSLTRSTGSPSKCSIRARSGSLRLNLTADIYILPRTQQWRRASACRGSFGLRFAAPSLADLPCWRSPAKLVASIRHNANWETARDWIGALSGWAAFFAAAASLPYLVGQWLEAKRQTAFIVGDCDPDFIIYRNRQRGETYLTVRNWNRRRVMVGKISILRTTAIEIENVVDRQNSSKSWKSMKAAGESGEFKLDGWIDRNSKPPERSFIINPCTGRQASSRSRLRTRVYDCVPDTRSRA